MSNTFRLLGLDALSSVDDWVWGSVATGEPALVLDSGGRAKGNLWERACRMAGFDPSEAARYDRLGKSGVVMPQSETQAAFRLLRDCAPGKPEWFSVLADSEALFCHGPRPAGDLRLLPAWPSIAHPAELPRTGLAKKRTHPNALASEPEDHAHREAATPPSRPLAGGFALRPTPAPMALLQPTLALSYAPARAPIDPDWTRLRHPEFAHIGTLLAWDRLERRASVGGRIAVAAALGVAAALAGIIAAAFLAP